MPYLFSPYQLKSVQLKNRIVVSPMCQYSAVDGFANNWHFVHLGSRAVGGAGLVMTEATAVSPEGRISPEDLGIYKEGHIEKLREITAFIEQQGAVPGIQLAHAGRKGSTFAEWRGSGAVPLPQGGWQTIAPSAVRFADHYGLPQAMDKADIIRVQDDFRKAAERAYQAGFKIIEIHAAHGYLVHQFLSPVSNQRTDEYGGSFENRVRFLLEIIDKIHTAWPSTLPVFVRISATDWVGDKGWNENETLQLSKILEQKGIDLMDVSSGGMVPDAVIPVGASYQLPFASLIKKNTGISVGTVGMITNAAQAESILVNKDADLIFMAREMLRDPYWPLQAARELHYDLNWPDQYRRAKQGFRL